MKKKAAILIPGLVRTYKKTYKTFANQLAHNHHWDIDVYLAFWDQTHARGGSPPNVPNVNVEEVLELYKPQDHMVLDYGAMNEEFERVLDGVISIIGITTPQGRTYMYNAIVSQFYGWQQVMSLLEGNYELVIKSRFDIDFDIIDFDQINLDVFSCMSTPARFKHYGVEDFMFMGNQQNMEKIMNVYKSHLVAQNLPLDLPQGYPEYILRHVVSNELGLPIQRVASSSIVR